MKRSPWDRLVALACALWLVAVLSEPAALHTCAEHGAAHGSMRGHGGASQRGETGGSHSHETPTERHGCTCVGACCCFAVASVLPAQVDVLTLVASHAVVPAIVTYASDFRPSAAEYARPPTIGPPRFTA